MQRIQGQVEEERALEALVEQTLAIARKRGATAAEASVGQGTGLSVTVRMGELETIEHQRDKGLSVTVYLGGRTGSARTSDLRPEAIAQTVEAARQIASFGGEDECAGLADPALMAQDIPDLDCYHPWGLGPEEAAELALRAESTAREQDRRITNSEGASVGSREALRVYGNSHGFIGSFRGTRHSLSAALIAEADGAKQRDYWYTSARSPDGLDPAEAVGRRAAERALRRLGGRQVPTAKVPVLYAAEVAGSLVGHLVGAISGGSLYRRASFLVDQLGSRIFPPGLRIAEQPRLPRGLGSAAFDGDGVATRDRDIVADGVLEGYVLSAYSARKLGLQTTGNAGGVRNVSVSPGWYGSGGAPGAAAPDLEGLLRSLGRGLYLTELIGMGVNTVTGDYSRGAAGFWVEDGALAHPVEEITVAGNLRAMFAGINAVGADVDRRGNIRTGSILIDEMTVAGA